MPPRTAPVESCPVCRSAASEALFRARDKLHHTPGEYAYRRCRECRTVFQDPRVVPEDLPQCYPAQYYTHCAPPALSTEDSATPRRLSALRDPLRDAIVAVVQGEAPKGLRGGFGRMLASRRRLRERAFYDCVIDELIPGPERGRRALEIGCGAGELMQRLQRVGWEVEGAEWDASAAEVARKASGRPVLVGDFREVALALGHYDLVVLNHVFEHLADPLAALGRIEQLLAPGGRAVLIYPNPRALGARVYRSAWFDWDVPRHLVLPSVPALAKAARAAGLTVRGVRTSARFAAAHSAPSRAYRAGRAADETVHGVSDKAFGLLERALVALGLDLGEEAILVLGKGPKERARIPP